MSGCSCCHCPQWCHWVVAVVVCFYSIFLYRDREKLRSFPIVNRIFYGRTKHFVHPLPPLVGWRVVVTGANSGLGKASVRAMARAGAEVVMACRSMTKCQAVRADLIAQGGISQPENLIIREVDLALLSSVQRFAHSLRTEFDTINVLMLNAGAIHGPHQLTSDNIEMEFQVNYLSQFLLTRLLLPQLEAAAPRAARVVSVTSDAHHYSYWGGIRGAPDLESINNAVGSMPFLNYAQSKLCNILFIQELAQRVQPRGIFANVAHPGLVQTAFIHNWFRDAWGLSENHAALKWLDDFIGIVLTRIGIMYDEDEAALTQLYLAVSPSIESLNVSGQYYIPVADRGMPHPHASNQTLQKALWALSDRLVSDYTRTF